MKFLCLIHLFCPRLSADFKNFIEFIDFICILCLHEAVVTFKGKKGENNGVEMCKISFDATFTYKKRTGLHPVKHCNTSLNDT